MSLTGISLLGWLHSFACIIAIVTGAYVLCARKGTSRHRLWGWWYAVAMVVQSLLALGLYNFDFIPGSRAKPGPHVFGFFHVSSLMTLAAIALALWSAPRQRKAIAWALIHTQAMLFTYYMLISALINEAFARVMVLRHYALIHSPHSTTTIATIAVRQTQLVWLLLWLATVIYAAVTIAGHRKAPAQTIDYPLRYTGGIFLLCVGAGIVCGALLNATAMPWGLLAGFAVGIATNRRVRPVVTSRSGSPSVRQGQIMAFAIALEIASFNVMGASGAFTQLSRAAAWEISLAIVGFHFLVMRWSHGPWMFVLGAAVLAWLGISIELQMPLRILLVGDGLLKMGLGAVMAWPLLRLRPTAPAAP